MSKANSPDDDDLLSEYDFASMKGGVRGKYVGRLRKGSNLVLLEPEVAEAFPSDAAVNEALRGILNTARAVRGKGGLPDKALQPTSSAAGRNKITKTRERDGETHTRRPLIQRSEEVPMERDARTKIKQVFGKHGYNQFTNDSSVVRMKGAGKFGERLAVHPEGGAYTLYVRRGGRERLRAIAAEVDGVLDKHVPVLSFPGLDIHGIDRSLAQVKASLKRHP